jgi:hypothetical protein
MMTFSKVRLRDAMVSRRTFDLRARRVEWPVARGTRRMRPTWEGSKKILVWVIPTAGVEFHTA